MQYNYCWEAERSPEILSLGTRARTHLWFTFPMLSNINLLITGKLSMMVSIWNSEAERLPWIQSQPDLYSKFFFDGVWDQTQGLMLAKYSTSKQAKSLPMSFIFSTWKDKGFIVQLSWWQTAHKWTNNHSCMWKGRTHYIYASFSYGKWRYLIGIQYLQPEPASLL